jgi:hypothetical protein
MAANRPNRVLVRPIGSYWNDNEGDTDTEKFYYFPDLPEPFSILNETVAASVDDDVIRFEVLCERCEKENGQSVALFRLVNAVVPQDVVALIVQIPKERRRRRTKAQIKRDRSIPD